MAIEIPTKKLEELIFGLLYRIVHRKKYIKKPSL